MPFQNWYTANTNNFELTDSVSWKSKRQLGWVINIVQHNLVRRIRFWKIKSERKDFKCLYWTISKIIFWNLFTCKGTYMIDWVGRISKMVKINIMIVQPIPLGVTFRKLKAQSSKVSFATLQWKQTFELWALSFETTFENVTPSEIGCTSMIDNGFKNASRSHLGWHFRMLFRAQSSKLELLFSLKRGYCPRAEIQAHAGFIT